jgi:hypothetical protein
VQVVLYKVTARRSKSGLQTIKREVLGPTGDDPDAYLDRLARILAAELSAEQIKKEVEKLSNACVKPRAQPAG